MERDCLANLKNTFYEDIDRTNHIANFDIKYFLRYDLKNVNIIYFLKM